MARNLSGASERGKTIDKMEATARIRTPVVAATQRNLSPSCVHVAGEDESRTLPKHAPITCHAYTRDELSVRIRCINIHTHVQSIMDYSKLSSMRLHCSCRDPRILSSDGSATR